MRGVMAAVALAATVAGTAQAQDVDGGSASWASVAGLSGSVRGGYWVSSRTLDDDRHLGSWTLWARASPPAWKNIAVLVDGWIQGLGPDRSADDARGSVREAFVRLRLGDVDVRAGRQIIAWGRADGINPTDNLTPRNFTLLTAEDDEQRLGTTSVALTYYRSGLALSAVWLPEFRPPILAIPAPPGVSIRDDGERWPADQWAARVDKSGGAVDWSLSYFHGRQTTPTLRPGAGAGAQLDYQRARVIGADMATTVGRFGIRGEAAYTVGSTRGDPFARRPFFLAVGGLERTWREHLNVNAQYLLRVVDGGGRTVPDPFFAGMVALNRTIAQEERRVQHGATLRVAHRWLHETLEAEFNAAAVAAPDGFTLRPRVSYAVTDRWTVVAGADLLGGAATSPFGMMRDNTTAFTEFRWGF